MPVITEVICIDQIWWHIHPTIRKGKKEKRWIGYMVEQLEQLYNRTKYVRGVYMHNFIVTKCNFSNLYRLCNLFPFNEIWTSKAHIKSAILLFKHVFYYSQVKFIANQSNLKKVLSLKPQLYLSETYQFSDIDFVYYMDANRVSSLVIGKRKIFPLK